MIPAPPGIVVQCKQAAADGGHQWVEKPVIAFDDNGEPLVLGRQHLEHAYGDVSWKLAHYIAVLPPGGWWVEFAGEDGGKRHQPLIGWAVRTDGLATRTVALMSELSGTGNAVEVGDYAEGGYRIYHPDARNAS